MTQDERLLPVRSGRDIDTTLAEIAQGRTYGRYSRYGGQSDNNLREYLFVLLKRKWLILSLVLVITSLVAIQAYREPSIYQGSTTIRIEPKQGSILQSGGAVLINQSDPNFWGTQLKLLQSPTLARQVVLTLDLQHNPEFLGGQASSTVFSSLKRLFGRERTAVGPAQGQNSEPDPVGERELQERQLTADQLAELEPYEDAIIGNETITPIEKTNLVIINYNHTNPDLAKRIADTLADVFVTNNIERQELGTSKAERVLAAEIAKTQEKVKTERDARFNFAKDHNLSLGQTVNLEQKKEETYAQQLLDAENARRKLKAEYESAKAADDPFTNPTVQSDELIRKLREKLSDLKEKREALLQVYTPEWPEVKKLDAQITSTQKDLEKAPAQVLTSMKKKYEASEAQEKSLVSAYSQQHGKTTAQTKAEIDLAAMTQDLTTDEQYLNTLFQKQRELTATAGDGGTNVSIATPSRVPHEPVGPARLRSIIIAFLLSLMAGIGLAFLLDFLDDSVKSLDDIDRYIHLPALALIPAAHSDRNRLGSATPTTPQNSAALALMEDVRSPIAEAYRHLRTSLLLSSAGNPPKTILVTSSQPSEGKTTTAINTAFMLAQTGAEVLIIDCDLRRPRLHANFNLSNTRGLTNYLSGESPIEDLLQSPEKTPNLKLLTSGPIPPNPAELLGSEEMRKLLKSLSERFTHIVVDSPPAISFTDASILSTFVDGVILVVHGGRSSRAVVRRARQQLLDVGANIFGVVLNNVKAESRDYYGAGYYSPYYQSDYYTEADEGDESARAAAR